MMRLLTSNSYYRSSPFNSFYSHKSFLYFQLSYLQEHSYFSLFNCRAALFLEISSSRFYWLVRILFLDIYLLRSFTVVSKKSMSLDSQVLKLFTKVFQYQRTLSSIYFSILAAFSMTLQRDIDILRLIITKLELMSIIFYQDIYIIMTEEQLTLKWGDIIRIYGVNLSKSKQSKGLIISKGFTDPNIYYQKYTDFQEVNFYRQSLFQIMPRTNFDVHDQMLTADPKQMQVLRMRSKNQIKALQKALQLKVMDKLDVQYGSDVIFKHVESNSYLRGVMKAANTGEGAFMIQVCEDLSSQIVWKIRSHRSYQADGDPIYYNDELQIYHQGSDCFMNFDQDDKIVESVARPIYLDIKHETQPIPAEDQESLSYEAVRPSIKKPNNIRIAIINENKYKCLWKFIQHCSHDEFLKKQRIKSHDIVYFQHTKENKEKKANKALISTSLSKPDYYLKETYDTAQPYQPFQCYWQLIPNEVNELGPQNCNDFSARNIVTGRTLEYNGFKVLIKSKQEVEGGGFISQGLVNLICGENDRKLQRGNIIPKDQRTVPIIRSAQNLYSLYSLTDVQELTEDSFQIVKVDSKVIMNVQYIISAHEPLVKFLEVFSTHMIREKRADKKKEVRDSNGALITIPFYDFLSLELDPLANIKGILQLLSGKIYGTTYDNIATSGNNADKMVQTILVETGITELLIQMLYLLYDPFIMIERHTEASDDRAQRIKISQLFQRAYKLLEKIVVGNKNNKTYLSRWVDLFLKHSNTINREYIQQCLVGILQNNPQSIQLTINEDKINTLIKSFLGEAERNKSGDLTTKYLRLFSTFIKCQGDRVLKENQNIILKNFFLNTDNSPWSFRLKIVEKQDFQESNSTKELPNDPLSKIRRSRVDISLGKTDFANIPKFYKDWGPKWNYFLAFVNLLADVCMDRNNEAIYNVSALISLPIITTVLFDPDIARLNDEICEQNNLSLKEKGVLKYPIANVHQPFVRVAHYVYISNSKFDEIKRIKNISGWYRYEKLDKNTPIIEEINRTKRPFEGEKQEEEKLHLTSILKYIQNFIENCNQDNSNLDILYTVLNLLKETIVLGLWESIHQFRKLIPLLIMRIVKIEEKQFFDADEQTRNRLSTNQIIKKNKLALSFNRPEIRLMIDCKIKTTQIFRYINELQIDIRLRYMMNFFKGLYEATEIFQDYNKIDKQLPIDDESAKARNELAKSQFMANDSSTLLGEDVKKVSQDQQIMLKQNIWYNKFKELTPFEPQTSFDSDKDRYLFFDSSNASNTQPHSFEGMVLALFELPVFKKPNLLSSSLKMLKLIFQQRKDLINQFNKILICGKGNLSQVYSTLKYMRMKFNMLADHNILKLRSDSDEDFPFAVNKTYDPDQKIQTKRSGILQDLFFLTRTLKEGINLKNIELLMSVNQQIFAPGIVYDHLNQKQTNNKLFQEVNLAQGIYIPLIRYIQIIGNRQFGETHRRILFAIYHYLSLLCFNNLEAKQTLMEYIPDILPHLKRKVGATAFLYQCTLNNKLLVSNVQLVKLIIQQSLAACIELDRHTTLNPIHHLLYRQVEKTNLSHHDFEKPMILFSLRGILLLNSEGHRINQQILLNGFQQNKYKKLVYKQKIEFNKRRQDFNLSPEESYVATHFELFSVLVESKNFINIGKLQNIHKYSDCLEWLKSTNRWQIRRSLRAYINRLYYVNKDRDVFIFQEFIRKEFKIINNELDDLIFLHRNKLIHDDIIIQNGIRFKFAQSEIFEMIIQIFITVQEMLLKPQFMKVLRREIEKQEKKPQNQRQLHDQLVKLLQHLGCLNLIYTNKTIINSFNKEVFIHLSEAMHFINEKYLQKQSRQDVEMPIDEGDDLGAEPEKKNYVYDHSKSFFRNLNCMIRDIKAREKKQEMKAAMRMKENTSNSNPEELKKIYIDMIYSVQGQNLKPIVSRRYREVSSSLYKPHLHTANSRIFKVIAKPSLTQNEQNIELNSKLSIVKETIDNSPLFRKLKEDEFFKLVTTLTNIDETSKQYYMKQWYAAGEKKVAPVVSLKEILTLSFQLMRNKETAPFIQDVEKIFILKLARCYITQAIEGKQAYKLPVDKWDLYSDDATKPSTEDDSELIRRQNLIMECGGSQLITAIFKDRSLYSKVELLNETLLLGIAYLFNGNTDCQNSVLTCLKKDKQNLMMLNLQYLITTLGNFLIELRKTKEGGKARKSKFAYDICDTYYFFDIKDYVLKQNNASGPDKFEAISEKAIQMALCRLFRFMQLFCQNNNVAMKKFLLVQINEPDQSKVQNPEANSDQSALRKSNSINFIQVTTLLLRKLFKIMNRKVVNIPATLLDFLMEITQLPCLDNQISLMKSTFFQDLSYLADFFLSPENLLARGFHLLPEEEDDPLNQLFAIYQTGIDLALCNFQGNDNVLIWEFISKCQPKFLWIVIKQNYMVLLREKAEQLGIQKSDDDDIQENQRENRFIYDLLTHFNHQTITNFIKEEEMKSPMFREEICNILSVLYILKKIDVYAGERMKAAFAKPDVPNKQQNQKSIKAYEFRNNLIKFAAEIDRYEHINAMLAAFQQLILSIEIFANNGKEDGFQLIYFPKHPVFNELAPQTKNQIMMEVKRETPRDKQISLLEHRQEVYNQVELNYELRYGKLKIPYVYDDKFSITAEYSSHIRKTARWISWTICVLMAIFILVDHDPDEQTSTFTFNNIISEIILRVACAVQFVYTLWYVFLWLKLRKPLALRKWDEQILKEKEAEAKITGAVKLQQKKIEDSELEGWDLMVRNIHRSWANLRPSVSAFLQKIKSHPIVRNVFISFYALFCYEGDFLSLFMFVAASFLGNFVGIQWFTIHIFDVFTDKQELTNIFKAILQNIKKLTLLAVLCGVFILVFNVISFNTYTPAIYPDNHPEQTCEELIDCVLELYTAGAIGDSMDSFEPYRFIFDIIYVVFMDMLFSNIVTGLMIDSFSALKEADEERNEDKKNICYICNKTKEDMEKQGSTFDKHVARHFLWNYLFYIYCLERKNETDFTGLQFDIQNKKNSEDTKWFPAMGSGDTEGQQKQTIQGLEQKVKQVNKMLGEVLNQGKEGVALSMGATQKIIQEIGNRQI